MLATFFWSGFDTTKGRKTTCTYSSFVRKRERDWNMYNPGYPYNEPLLHNVKVASVSTRIGTSVVRRGYA